MKKIYNEEERIKAWEFAFGLIKVDDMVPSEFLKELVKKEIAGEITTEEMLDIIIDKYKVSDEHDRYRL